MTMKGVAKLKGKLICGLKNDIRFSCELSKVWKFALWLKPFVQSMQRFRWKGRKDLSLMAPKSDAKFDEKLTFHLKNDIRNLVNFNLSSRKSQNLHFDGLLLLSVCSGWAKNIQRSCEKWFIVPKVT